MRRSEHDKTAAGARERTVTHKKSMTLRKACDAVSDNESHDKNGASAALDDAGQADVGYWLGDVTVEFRDFVFFEIDSTRYRDDAGVRRASCRTDVFTQGKTIDIGQADVHENGVVSGFGGEAQRDAAVMSEVRLMTERNGKRCKRLGRANVILDE
jgi:hypothetical protein